VVSLGTPTRWQLVSGVTVGGLLHEVHGIAQCGRPKGYGCGAVALHGRRRDMI